MKKTSALILAILAIVAIATATIVIKVPVKQPEPLAPARVYLNQILHNDSSQFDELKGLDKKVEAYMRRWNSRAHHLQSQETTPCSMQRVTDGQTRRWIRKCSLPISCAWLLYQN